MQCRAARSDVPWHAGYGHELILPPSKVEWRLSGKPLRMYERLLSSAGIRLPRPLTVNSRPQADGRDSLL
jgi:hypothetical protein